MEYLLIIVTVVGVGGLLLLALKRHEQLPEYPVKVIDLNVTGQRGVDTTDILQQYMIDHGIEEFREYYKTFVSWKRECAVTIQHSFFPARCEEKYQEMLNYNYPFCFRCIRWRTRYKQQNYIRQPYKVKKIEKQFFLTFDMLEKHYQALRQLNFETTTKKYHMKNQRKLMTPALREQIKKRDHYTCQICGKQMFDEVGLHIDHIIPISKGGKTVPSNLQVLCDKCNLRKSAKY